MRLTLERVDAAGEHVDTRWTGTAPIFARPARGRDRFTVRDGLIARMLGFRDRLRADPADRGRYLRTKRELAARRWRYVQDYADAKSAVVEDILTRAGGPTTPPARG
jgi:GrpB-like predicted nucleotidyltransferase (UPF0157 family)